MGFELGFYTREGEWAQAAHSICTVSEGLKIR